MHFLKVYKTKVIKYIPSFIVFFHTAWCFCRFIHIVVQFSNLSLYIAKECYIEWICHSLFKLSPVVEHLDCFRFGASINRAAVNILCEHDLFFSWISRKGLAESYDRCIFILWRKCPTFFYVIVPFYIATSRV